MESLEYRWGDTGPFQALESIARQPPGRPAGDVELQIRVTVPAIDAEDPALDVFWPIPLRSVTVGERRIGSEADHPGLIPLRREDRGQPAVLHLAGPMRLASGPIRFGSQRALWSNRLRADLPSIAVGITLAIVGLLFAVLSLRRRAPELRSLALFGLCAGGFAIGQSPVFRSMLWGTPGGWRVLSSAFAMLMPVALARFAAEVFGDTRWSLLRRGASVMLVVGAAEIALHLAGVADLSSTRRFDQALLLGMFVLLMVRLVPRARGGDRTAAVLLLGLSMLFASAVPDLAWGFGYPLFQRNTTPFGLVAFVVALGFVARLWQDRQHQALATSRAELELRVADLQRQRTDIETLNDELRHQIEKRSRELRTLLGGATASAPSAVLGGLEPGTLVDGRYRVTACLGAGAMGAVYDVGRTTDGKRFALKVMTGRADATQSARFAREAEVAARVKHPNVVAIVDVGVDPEGFLFLVMERVQGRSLEEARASFGDARWGLPILLQIARGLGALHQRGVVHRDIKPANVLLQEAAGSAPVARVADLGVARDLGDAIPFARTLAGGARPSLDALGAAQLADQLTAAGDIVGTPRYIAPELASGDPAGPAADVFSFGILAWEVLTGAYPFAVPPLLHAFTGKTAPPIEPDRDREMPPGVRATLLRALAWAPEGRPTAAELEAALRSALDGA